MSSGQRFRIGEHVVVDFQTREFTGGNASVVLRPKDWAVLQILVQRAPGAVSHEEFRHAVWDGVPNWSNANLHTVVSKLRKALAVEIHPLDGTYALITPVGALSDASLSPADSSLLRQPTFLLRWAISATALAFGLALALSVVLWKRAPGAPVIARWSGPVLTAFDSEERPVWRHRFLHPVMDASETRKFEQYVGDLDADGTPEILAVYPHTRREEEGWGLYCLSSTGKISWTLSPTTVVKSALGSFKQPYVIREYTTFPSPDRDTTTWTAAVFVHHTNYPSVLMVADSHGKVRGEYWNVGHLQTIRSLTIDGKERIVVGGVEHGVEQAVVLLFDPKNVHGGSVMEPSSRDSQFHGMLPGTQLATVYIPRSRYNIRYGRFNIVDQIQIIGQNVIQASVYEHVGQRRPRENQPEAYLIYKFNPSFELKDLEISVAYTNALKLDPELSSSQFPPQEEIADLKKKIRVIWHESADRASFDR